MANGNVPQGQDPNAHGGSQGGGGGPPMPDWSQLLEIYGIPQEVIDQLNNIWTQYSADPNQQGDAVTAALDYIRGTDWYKAQFPNIQDGINNGLFQSGSREQDYRSYVAGINSLYQQYYGRNATNAEITAYIQGAHGVDYVSNTLHGQAILGTLSDPLKAEFTSAELTAYANFQAGIDTPLGERISQEVDLYQNLSLLYKNFYGSDITRSQLDNIFTQGLTPQQISQQFSSADSINAMLPSVKALFSADELQQIGLEAAGGVSQHGQQLQEMASYAQEVQPYLTQYGITNFNRDTLNNLWSSGVTPTQYGEKLQGDAYAEANKKPIELTMGAGGEGSNSQLSQQDLQTYGEELAGYDTPMGQKLTLAFQQAQQRIQGAFQGTLARNSDWLGSQGRAVTKQNQQDVGS